MRIVVRLPSVPWFDNAWPNLSAPQTQPTNTASKMPPSGSSTLDETKSNKSNIFMHTFADLLAASIAGGSTGVQLVGVAS